MSNKKVLVTGGAGFIGSHLVDALIDKGFKVVVIDNLSTGKISNLNPQAVFYKISITNKKIKDIFKKEKFDYVFHLAAQMNVRLSVADPLYDAKVNIMGTLNLLNNSVAHNVKKFIFSSSGGAIYGDADIIPTPEDFETKPVSPYGVAKLTGENYLYYFDKVHKLPYVALRYANVYGPGQRSDSEAGVVSIFAGKALRGEQPVINGDGKNTRDYVYVSDVVKANLLSLNNKMKGAYNIGTSKETTVNQIFDKIAKISGKNVKEKHGPAKKGEQRRSCLSFQKIKKDLGWEPSVNLNEGIKNIINWLQAK